MAETTQDEREPEGSKDEQEPEGSKDEREPERSKDEQEPEGSNDEQEPEGSEDEREPEASEKDQDTEDEREPEPKDLPEPEEKSADDLVGQQMVDSHGYTIGKIEALFIHGHDERASWALVKTGLVRKSSAFVPLHDAQEDGRQIRVVYEKEHVNEAPEIEPDGNELSDEEADMLHGFYGLERVTGLTKETAEEDIELPREPRDANPPTMKDPPWAVEKYPLPDMERPEGEESSGPEGEGSSEGEESPGEDSSHSESSAEDSEERGGG